MKFKLFLGACVAAVAAVIFVPSAAFAANVVVTPATDTIAEDGGTTDLVVTFGTDPGTGTWIINIVPSGTGITVDDYDIVEASGATANDNTIELTSDGVGGGTWSTGVTVTVNGTSDMIDEGASEDLVLAFDETTTHTDGSATVTLTDNDTAGVSFSAASVAVTEGGAGVAYTVTLDSEPTGDVIVNVAGDPDVNVSPSSVTLNSTNYSTGLGVTATAIDDATVEGAHTGTITHVIDASSATEYVGVTVADVTANITDNDTSGVTITPTTADITEGGATDTYTVVLDTQPTDTVTVTIDPGTEATVADTTLDFTTATGIAGGWNMPQTVTLTAVDDTTVEGSHLLTVTHTATSTDTNYNGATIDSVAVTITDNDEASSGGGRSGGGWAPGHGPNGLDNALNNPGADNRSDVAQEQLRELRLKLISLITELISRLQAQIAGGAA